MKTSTRMLAMDISKNLSRARQRSNTRKGVHKGSEGKGRSQKAERGFWMRLECRSGFVDLFN